MGEFGFPRFEGLPTSRMAGLFRVKRRARRICFFHRRGHAGNLWISNQDEGLFHLLRGSVVERYPGPGWGVRNLPWLYSLILCGAVYGLDFCDGGVAYFQDGQVRASYTGADGLGEGRVNGFRLDGDGTLWAATEGGLSRVKNGRVATLTSKNGLPCDPVHWVIEDEDHSFWL